MTIWLNAEQVAARLNISKRTAMSLMYQMQHSVICGNVRKRIRVSESSLDAWMAKRSNKLPVKGTATGSKRRLERR